ncbi:integrin beta-8 [Lepisosteus oculatus]|uniref:Integrin beta n=1 Tax=Lepisosteus oculatus TaxID=7918 RepID=W5N095_LEPOC|nr:PREDICTED: integrin beta-8 [Lepisosteus oculatus]
MTSSPQKHRRLLQRMVCALYVTVVIGTSEPAANSCTAPHISSCKECLKQGAECGWCFQEGFLDGAPVSERCDLISNLEKKGCALDFIERPSVKVVVDASTSSTQVTPRDVTVQLWPGREASFVLQVRQLERYPVDMYYLVDVSASMQDNLDKLKTVGIALSEKMKEHSTDFKVGFGSFVDKPVSPYINVHPSKIDNPCSDYDIQCRPAHGFIHVLSLTDNITEFTRVVHEQHISGNMDTPEGGFDAMLQAAVCQNHIGWRSEAKHLLLMMTDQPSHLALDSKLAGIVVPHDGNCHLEDNTYTQSAYMEHPTIGQLADKLLENSVHSIFAVEELQYKWYEDLIPLMPGTFVGKLQPKASNLKDLVVQAYKRLLSDVEVQILVQNQVQKLAVNITALCPGGNPVPGHNKCSNVKPNETVFFNITIGMRECGNQGEAVDFLIKPVGFNESTRVKVQTACACQCTGPGAPSSGRCWNERSPQDCRSSETGSCTCEQGGEEGGLGESCRLDDTQPACSGRGSCLCGRCVCARSSLGLVFGKYCEMDNFSCSYHRGLLCGGHGQCVLGECRCASGWEGESCSCPTSTEPCMPTGSGVCSGKGRCVCGRCQCEDPRRSGRFCEVCPMCNNPCETNWKCVQCHLSSDFSEVKATQCNATCFPMVHYIDDISESRSETSKYCLYPTSENCHYRFQMDSMFGGKQIHIIRYPECLSEQQYFPTFTAVFLITIALGLMLILILKYILARKNRRRDVSSDAVNDVSPKDMSYLPTMNEKTITYRRDRPVEMRIHVHKMPLNEIWQCEKDDLYDRAFIHH